MSKRIIKRRPYVADAGSDTAPDLIPIPPWDQKMQRWYDSIVNKPDPEPTTTRRTRKHDSVVEEYDKDALWEAHNERAELLRQQAAKK